MRPSSSSPAPPRGLPAALGGREGDSRSDMSLGGVNFRVLPVPTAPYEDPGRDDGRRLELPVSGAGPPVIPFKAATDRARSPSRGERVPASTIEQSFSAKRNSLNFLRLVLAIMVVFSHSITVGRFGSEWILGKTTLGTVAVYGFFGISGYLIAGSAARNNAGRYLWQRFLRIFPAFWICLLVTALLFGTIAWLHLNRVSQGLWTPLLFHRAERAFRVRGAQLLAAGESRHHRQDGARRFRRLRMERITVDAGVRIPLLSAPCGVLRTRIAEPAIARRRDRRHRMDRGDRGSSRPPLWSGNFTPLFPNWDVISVLGFQLETMKVLVLVPIFLSGSLLYLYRGEGA